MTTNNNTPTTKLQTILLTAYTNAIASICDACAEIDGMGADMFEIEQIVPTYFLNAFKSVANQASAGDAELGVKMGATTILEAAAKIAQQLQIEDVAIETPNPATATQIEEVAVAIETPNPATPELTVVAVAKALEISETAASAVIAGTDAMEEFCVNNLPLEVKIETDFIRGTKYLTNHSDDVDTLKVCLITMGVATPKFNAAIKQNGAELLKTRTSTKWVNSKLALLKIS